MFTCLSTIKLCKKFAKGTEALKVDGLSRSGVCFSNNRRNICLNHYLSTVSSQFLTSDSRINSNDNYDRKKFKYYRYYKLKTRSNVLNTGTLFSNCNFRQFSSSSVSTSDSDNLGNSHVLSADDNSTSTLADIPDESSSLLSTFEGSESATELSEPSLSSLGLGGWSPPGLVQSGLEYLHVDCHLPWWACIVCGTVLIRTAVLPLVIRFQKSIIIMNNTMPQIQLLQMKMTTARDSGNVIEANRYSNEMVNLVKDKKINPLKQLSLPLIQMPFFLSFFFGLRGMAELPVESLHNGGLWWFTDLTVCDPYYLLPVVTCLTMFLTIELGLETGVSPNQIGVKYVRLLIRSMPFLMFPIIINFPGVLLVYWFSSNMYTLVQSNVLRIPAVRNYCGFEASVDNTQSFNILKKMQMDKGYSESLPNVNMEEGLTKRKSFEVEEKLNKLKNDLKKNQQKL